jgi:hypothetical protein
MGHVSRFLFGYPVEVSTGRMHSQELRMVEMDDPEPLARLCFGDFPLPEELQERRKLGDDYAKRLARSCNSCTSIDCAFPSACASISGERRETFHAIDLEIRLCPGELY